MIGARSLTFMENVMQISNLLDREIGPISMQVIRIIVSFLGGALLTAAVILFDWLFLGTNIVPVWGIFALWAIFAGLIALPDEPFKIPAYYTGILTFFGFPIKTKLSAGDYTWIGQRFFFGRITGQIPGMSPNDFPPAADGLVYTGEYVIPIWNQPDREVREIVLTNVAADSSEVSANLTNVIRVRNPLTWIGSSDPVFDIAERSRSSFRTAVSMFTGVDCVSAKTLLSKLMQGSTIVTCFTTKQVGTLPAGSIIRDRSGKHLYIEVERDGDVSDGIRRFRAGMLPLADGKMLQAVEKKEEEVFIQPRSINDYLSVVVEGVGAELLRVSVSDMSLSKEVGDQANKAAGEVFQRSAQIQSAETTKEAQRILARPAVEGQNDSVLDKVLAASQDNDGVQIVYVPEGSDLTKALVAGAKQIGGSKK